MARPRKPKTQEADKPKRKPKGQPPPVVMIGGVPYVIPWSRFKPGCSFFIKTTYTADTVLEVLHDLAEHYGMVLAASNRHEFGYYGVRVWRML